MFIKGSDIVKCEISTYHPPKLNLLYVCFIIHTFVSMNLFWSVFVLYILPMVIYTMGKNVLRMQMSIFLANVPL